MTTPSSEFALIRAHFRRPTRHTDVGVGDDCALISPSPGQQLLISTDMLVEGRHFFADVAPADLGWKVAAVNISDIAAMGGLPRWIVLAASLPELDNDWVAAFSEGFRRCCMAFNVDIIGGDTTRGPRDLCATVIGEIASGQALRRNGAQPGEDIWVSGHPGRAALGLRVLRGEVQLAEPDRELCIKALLHPQPRVGLGMVLRGIASACLDVSDGLLGDLLHILEESAVGAEIEESLLPYPLRHTCGIEPKTVYEAIISGGDDYELLFTAPREQRANLYELALRLELPLTRIGRTTSASEQLTLITLNGQRVRPQRLGFDHFQD